MSPNRIVALVTPVCALAAGWAATWLADNVPGLNISKENLQAVFIAGAAAVLAPAIQWLHGWQKWEARNDAALVAAANGFPPETPDVAPVAAVAPADDDGLDLSEDDDFDELDDLVDFDDLEDTSVDEEEPVIAGS
jgi:hypothetical protein